MVLILHFFTYFISVNLITDIINDFKKRDNNYFKLDFFNLICNIFQIQILNSSLLNISNNFYKLEYNHILYKLFIIYFKCNIISSSGSKIINLHLMREKPHFKFIDKLSYLVEILVELILNVWGIKHLLNYDESNLIKNANLIKVIITIFTANSLIETNVLKTIPFVKIITLYYLSISSNNLLFTKISYIISLITVYLSIILEQKSYFKTDIHKCLIFGYIIYPLYKIISFFI